MSKRDFVVFKCPCSDPPVVFSSGASRADGFKGEIAIALGPLNVDLAHRLVNAAVKQLHEDPSSIQGDMHGIVDGYPVRFEKLTMAARLGAKLHSGVPEVDVYQMNFCDAASRFHGTPGHVDVCPNLNDAYPEPVED